MMTTPLLQHTSLGRVDNIHHGDYGSEYVRGLDII